MQYLLRFLRRGPISPRVHGTLDYLLAAALIAVPLAVDFHDDTATVLMLVLGGAATLLAIGTNWSTGIIRILPPVLHGVADIAATIVLIIAPFVLGFTDHTVATVLYVVIGAGGLGATLLTRFESDLMPAARIAPQQPLSEPSQHRWRVRGRHPASCHCTAHAARHARLRSRVGHACALDGGLASDRRALSGSRTGLLWRTHIGRIVGSVIAASRNSLLATISVGERSWKTLNRPGA